MQFAQGTDHDRHPIFHAIAHIDAPPRCTLHIPPRSPCRAPLGRKARKYPPSSCSALTPQPTSFIRPSTKTSSAPARPSQPHPNRSAHHCAHSQAAQPQPPKLPYWTTRSASHVHVTCASLARIRLYVPDGRTASVLVQHACGRVEGAYSAFRLVGARAGTGQNELLDDSSLEKMLVEVCGDDTDVGGPGTMSPGSS